MYFNEFYKNNKLIVTLLIIIIIYFIIYSNYLYKNTTNYIVKNWYNLKDNPNSAILTPLVNNKQNVFSGILANFIQYFTKLFKSFIGLFIKPFVYFIKLITKTLFSIKTTLNKFRNMAQVLRELFKVTVEKTADRINNSYSAILYLQEKIKLLIKKQSAMFTIFKQFSLSLTFILSSFVNGPVPRIVNFFKHYATLMFTFIGFCLACVVGGPFTKMIACPVCALCFDKNTPVHMTETRTIPIYQLSVNNRIYRGGKILGIIKVLSGTSSIYKYNNTIVSGSHLVQESNKWKRVENALNSNRILYSPDNLLYCLITENNLIISNNTTFSDYSETRDTSVLSSINDFISNYLNNTKIKTISKDHLYYGGFSSKTIIKINNKLVNINLVEINDKLENSYVIGLIELDGGDKILYNYKGIIVVGSQRVYENGLWISVYQSKYSTKVDYREEKIYHIITNNNKIKINDTLFTDFCESHDIEINTKIDNLLLDYKNKELS